MKFRRRLVLAGLPFGALQAFEHPAHDGQRGRHGQAPCRPSTSLSPEKESKTWITGTSPVMTVVVRPVTRVIARSLGDEAIHRSIYQVLDCFACARKDGRLSRSLSPKKKARRGSPGKPGEDGSGQA